VELKVSRPIQILALVLVIAGVGGVASLQLLGKSSNGGSSAPALSVAQLRARAHARSHPRTTRPAAAKATAHTAARPKQVVVPTAKPKPKPAQIVARNGLPIILADALRAHRIVVVSIFDPQSQTDAVSYAEARAGAADAGAGFLGVSVLDDTVAGPLTSALPGGGLLPDPGLLVYRAPGTLVERIDGFLDRDAVAQLVVSGHTATPITATTTTPATTTPATTVTP
jgi:hypothetical protein